MIRKSSVPWEISVTVKHLFAKFYNIDSEILEAEQKVCASFRRMRVKLGGVGLSSITDRSLIERSIVFDWQNFIVSSIMFD